MKLNRLIAISGINSGDIRLQKRPKMYVQTKNSNVRGRWTPYVAHKKSREKKNAMLFAPKVNAKQMMPTRSYLAT